MNSAMRLMVGASKRVGLRTLVVAALTRLPLLPLLPLLSLMALPPSCNTLPTQVHALGECGIGFAIWLRQPKSSQYQYFTVDGGVFAYGAGVTALTLKTFWQTDLSPKQCSEILELARGGGWFSTTPPTGTPDDGELVADIAVSWEGGRQQFVVIGEDPSVKAVTDLLTKVANVRFERALDRLPEAGKQAK